MAPASNEENDGTDNGIELIKPKKISKKKKTKHEIICRIQKIWSYSSKYNKTCRQEKKKINEINVAECNDRHSRLLDLRCDF